MAFFFFFFSHGFLLGAQTDGVLHVHGILKRFSRTGYSEVSDSPKYVSS